MFFKLFEYIRDLDDKYHDRRHEKYTFLGNGYCILFVVLVYYGFVKHIGPNFMANRPPYELRTAILVYNLVQVVCNTYLTINMVSIYIRLWAYESISCMMPHLDDSLEGMMELRYSIYYLAMKNLDLLDTVFFVLRKRYNQITFLHFYHHIMVTLSTYMFVRYLPGGQAGSLGLINTFVHIFMYLYYLVSALSPTVKKSLWWKKYITQVQILQFVLLTTHYLMNLSHSNCAYPKVMTCFCMFQSTFMLVLFGKFYYQVYIRSPESAKNTVATKSE